MSHAIHDKDSSSNPGLCNHCDDICRNWSKGFGHKDVYFPHYPEPDQLGQSAQDGCSLCAQFTRGGIGNLEEVKEAIRRREPEQFESRVVIDDGIRRNRKGRITTPEPQICLLLTYESASELHNEYSTPGLINERQLSVNVYPAANSEVTTFTNTRDALGTVSQWLETCRQSHPQCHQQQEATLIRLVSTEPDRTRLCLASALPTAPRYATLSHCWGQTRMTCLETGNLASFQEAIPSDALPRTFQDAIHIARELGFAYIWIDSLCICQDSMEDWMQQSALMSAVYSQSGLNIAAAHGHDSDAGCFIERLLAWRCRIQVAAASGQRALFDCVASNMFGDGSADMPLAERGWVLQERLLPARTVHFAASEIFWACRSLIASETFPCGLPEKVDDEEGYLSRQPVTRALWGWIVAQYTGLKLTFARDKLAAISGLARAIQTQTGDQYVAGLWRTDLAHQLAWTSGEIFERAPRATPYRAPSWSWVSMEGRISMPATEYHTDPAERKLWVRVLDVQLSLRGADPFGLLDDAVLALDCECLLRVRLQRSKYREDSMVLGRDMVRVTVYFDTLESIDEWNKVREAESTFAMPLFENVGYRAGRVTGLVLEPVPEKSGQYRRVGVFFTDKDDMTAPFRKAATNALCRAKVTDVVRYWRDEKRTVHNVIDLV